VGDTVSAESEIVAVDEARGWVKMDCRVLPKEGQQALRAPVEGLSGRFED
jgi:acyl dehydratase